MELTESLKEQLKSALNGANNPVTITLYKGDDPSAETDSILSLLKSIAEVISNVTIHEASVSNKISRYPAIQISEPNKESSYFYYGLPGGYEFSSLIEAIRTVASNAVDLDASLVEKIKAISKPVSLEIFVTPTCDKCPPMVIAGFRISRINPLVKVEVVEATSFRSYARGKGVMGVPKTIINDTEEGFTGGVPIEEFVNKIVDMAN